ncbi:MAG TPA: acyl carrier protein, partial [Mycobacterium sp.]|nr:acyl carrier protein [Mycobacterium sp.]
MSEAPHMTGDDAALRGTSRTDLTVADMRAWLRNWVSKATGQAPENINETAPLIELGLSSRDAVAMASDIEDFSGVTLSATVAFRHPTIEALAAVIVEGEPVVADNSDDEDWSRAADVADIA